MNRTSLLTTTALLVLGGTLAAFSVISGGVETDPLKIGAKIPMPDEKMATTAGEDVSFSDVRGERGLLVIFSCNTCPWVEKWEDRYHTTAAAARDADMGVILLNPNAALRNGAESLDAMRERAEKKGYTFPYAVDAEAAMADAFGANRTPEIFLFDSDMTLIYHGAIDDNARDASQVESPFLLDAIAAYKDGKEIAEQETKSIGCTIKRKKA